MTLRKIHFLLLVLASLIPAHLAWPAPGVFAFVHDPEVLDAELSPDGKHLAMVVYDGSRRVVVVRNVETPDMPIVGAFAENTLRPEWLYWGNNDRLLVSLSLPRYLDQVREAKTREGNLFDIKKHLRMFRMAAFDKDMSNMTVLINQRALRWNVSLSWLTNFLPQDPDHVLMTIWRNAKWNLFKVNINSGEFEFVVKGSARTFQFLSDEDGKPRYRIDYRERSNTTEFFELNDEDDWELVDTIHLSEDDQDSMFGNSLSLAGQVGDNLVYRKLNEDTGFYEFVEVDRDTKEQHTLFSLDDQDVYDLLVEDRSDELIGYRVEKDYRRDVYLDEAKQKLYDAIAAQVGNYNFEVPGLDPAAQRALVRVRGADDPLSYHLWDFETQELTFLANAHNDLARQNLSMPAMTTYVARDGTKLRAYILLPESFEPGKAYPTIILPHGGPQARSRSDFDYFAQFLSTRGYIVVQPNFRGSTGYGWEFEKAGYKQWGGVMQDDLTDAVSFMVRKGYTDPEKVCIVGTSYGGYAALMGAIKTPDLFKCAVSLNGVTHLTRQIGHFQESIEDYNGAWEEFLFRRIGHPEQDKDSLDAHSPALHANRITIPVMIVAGKEDETVPYKQAKLMVSALKEARVEHEFLALEDAGHDWFYYLDDRARVLAAVQEFLAAHLQ